MRRLLILLFAIIASAQLLAQTAQKTIPFTVILTKLTIADARRLDGESDRAGGRPSCRPAYV